jgi:hypothetical protein
MPTPRLLRIALFTATISTLGLGFPLARARAGLVFVEIADSSTPVPGASDTFGGFFAPSVSAGTAALTGLKNNTAFGIYTGSGGSLTRIADLNTAIPGGSGNFSSLDFSPSISGGTVAFQACRALARSAARSPLALDAGPPKVV